jgi:hypothetical protein
VALVGARLMQPPERENAPEPGLGRDLARICREALHIAFLVGLHFGLSKLIHYTHQENEWWARWLLSTTAVYAVVGFTVIAGAELLTDCVAAVHQAWRRIREE